MCGPKGHDGSRYVIAVVGTQTIRKHKSASAKFPKYKFVMFFLEANPLLATTNITMPFPNRPAKKTIPNRTGTTMLSGNDDQSKSSYS